jgi:exoribonuclease-2
MRITRQIQVGDNLRIKTAEVDPRKDIIYFQEAQQSTSGSSGFEGINV